MQYMIVFLVACAMVGLWSPARAKRGYLIVALTAALMLFFLIFPSKL